MHGVDGVDRGPSRSIEGARASPTMMALCASALQQHIVLPSRRRGGGLRAEVVGHSWNPEIGALLDGLFSPVRSAHEPVLTPHMLLEHCPATLGLDARECMRTYSQLLGVRRALLLRATEERARGIAYDAVLLSRWDVLWQRPLLPAELPGWATRAAGAVYLPHQCAARWPSRGVPSGPTPMKEAICGGTGSGWRASQAARECRAQDQRACQGDLTAAAREILVLDWWVLGGAAELDAFGAMVEGFSALTDEMRRDILVRGGSCMGHTYYGLQLRWMNATLRFVGTAPIDFNLGRMWQRSHCHAFDPACVGRERCGLDDALRRPWQKWPIPAATVMFPTPATFRGPSPLQRACADGLFFCNAVSRMCREGDAAAEPLDRTAARSLFVACADSTLYPQSSPPEPVAGTVTIVVGGARRAAVHGAQNGTRLAGVLLHLMSAVLAAAPAANASAAPPLPPLGAAAAGDGDGAAAAAPSRPASLIAALRARADALLGGPPPANHAACRRAFKLSDGGRATLPAPLRPGLCAPLPPREPSTTNDDGPRAWGNCSRGEAGGWTAVAGADLRACRQLCDGCARCKYVATAPSRGECAWHARCSLDALHVVGDGAEYFTVSRRGEPKKRGGG